MNARVREALEAELVECERRLPAAKAYRGPGFGIEYHHLADNRVRLTRLLGAPKATEVGV